MKLLLYVMIMLLLLVNLCKVLIISVENLLFVGFMRLKMSAKSKTNHILLENYIKIH